MEEFIKLMSENLELVNLIAGLIGGGFIGFRIGIKKNVKQSQKAGDNSNQIQINK